MHIVYIVLTFALVFLIIILTGKIIKKFPANVLQRINWTSFFLAAVSGLLLYLKATIIQHNTLLFIFALSLILYFISYNYNRSTR